ARRWPRPVPSTLLDLPGFGASPEPPTAWSTAEYADAVAELLAGAVPSPSPASGGGSEWGSDAGTSDRGASPHRPHPNPPPLAGEGNAAAAVQNTAAARRVWIGHSFGGRVGLQLA